MSQQRVTPGEQFHAPGEVRRVRLAAPTETCLMSEGIDRGLAIRAMTESPYGDQLAYQTGEGAWRIIDLRDVDCQHPDAGPESVPLFKVFGFPYFLPDGRSVVIGNSPLYQPPDETPGLFLVNLATPGQGVAINAPLAEDELVTDYRSVGDGKTFVYASRPRRCIDSSGTQCAGASASGLYATDISAPGEVTTLLNAEASAGLSSWAVVPR